MEGWWEYKLVYRIAASGISDDFLLLWHTASLWFWMPVFVVIIATLHASTLSIPEILKLVFTPVLTFLSAELLAYLFQQKGPCAFEEIRILSKSLSMVCSETTISGAIPHAGAALWTSIFVQLYSSVKQKRMSLWFYLFLYLIALIYLTSGLFTMQFFISDALAGMFWGILLTFATRNLFFI